MRNVLNAALVLCGLALTLVALIGVAFAITYVVVLVVLRRAPLVGRRYRMGPLVGREPIETASSKLSRR
jgi:hypothetical protein